MKRFTYTYPKSRFLSVDKDMNLIISRLFKNERLKKLLYYTGRDALEQPNLTDEQMVGMIDKNIKNVPKLYVDGSVLNYVIINFDNFRPNAKNTKHRDNIVEFDIVCHYDQWKLKDFQLRPYKIAAEIDGMLDGKHLTGIGDLLFLGCNQIIVNTEFAGLCLSYLATHGTDDEKNALTEEEDIDIIKNYNKLFNDKPWQIEG